VGCDALLVYCEREPPRDDPDVGWWALAECRPLCDVYPMVPDAELVVAEVEGDVDPAEAARRLGAHIVHVVKDGKVASAMAWGSWHACIAFSSLGKLVESKTVMVEGGAAKVMRYRVRLCRLCPLCCLAHGILATPCSPRVSVYAPIAPFLLEPVVNVAELLRKPVVELLRVPEAVCDEMGLDGDECSELEERHRELREWLEALKRLPESVKRKLYIVKWC